MMHQAVLGGGGIGLSLPLFMVIEDLEAGRLVPVLNGWHRPSQQTYVACKKDDWKIRNIRLFATWWAQKLRAQELDSERRFVQLYDLHSLQVLKM
jgi:DNA-binding transcriptional LysR family regulator